MRSKRNELREYGAVLSATSVAPCYERSPDVRPTKQGLRMIRPGICREPARGKTPGSKYIRFLHACRWHLGASYGTRLELLRRVALAQAVSAERPAFA